MKRTTIMLPEGLKAEAVNYARKNEISLGELIRMALEHEIRTDRGDRKHDLLFEEPAVYDAEAPPDLSENHDEHLYGKDT